MRDVKVIPNEECVTQHKLLVCDARIVKSEDRCKKFVPKRRLWKLQQADLPDKFYETFTGEMSDISGEQVDLVEVETRFILCYREDLWVEKERHMEKTKVVVE